MSIKQLVLKKGEDRRLRAGHPWIYSNEVNTSKTPLKLFMPGEEVVVASHQGILLGSAYANPHSLIVARLFSVDANQRLDFNFFKERIENAALLRQQLFQQPYYRLVFGEADQLPGLIIDRFGDDFVLQLTTAGMEAKQALIVEVLRTLFPNLHTILLRNDSAIREAEGLPRYVRPIFGIPPEEIIIEENNARFSMPLYQGQKTGWFFDHRMNRRRLRDYVAQKTVLDVFSYLGGFGILAALSGATHVDCIDASPLATAYIKKNAQLNAVENKIGVITEDSFDALKRLLKEKKLYDVIILDPPAFVKKLKDKKEGLLAYQRLNELAMQLLTPNGMLVSCSCSMHISMDDLISMLQRVMFRTKSACQILERGHQGPDHPVHLSLPEMDYLKAVFVRKIN